MIIIIIILQQTFKKETWKMFPISLHTAEGFFAKAMWCCRILSLTDGLFTVDVFGVELFEIGISVDRIAKKFEPRTICLKDVRVNYGQIEGCWIKMREC